MQYVVAIDYSKCCGCRICEVACSLKHVKKIDPDRSLIRIIGMEEAGQLRFIPVTCMQCEKAACELVCPTSAITRDPKTGARTINSQKCIGCSYCSYACPLGACYVDRVSKRAVVCNQCDGEPICVKLCPTSALQYVSGDQTNVRLKRARAQRLIDFIKLPSVPVD